MDNNVVRTLNEGPMGPQGPVKVNNCIMNKEAGFEPVVRIYPHTWPETGEDEETITGGTGGETISGGDSTDTITGETGGESVSGGTSTETITGGTGDSTIPGSDTIPGGEGE